MHVKIMISNTYTWTQTLHCISNDVEHTYMHTYWCIHQEFAPHLPVPWIVHSSIGTFLEEWWRMGPFGVGHQMLKKHLRISGKPSCPRQWYWCMMTANLEPLIRIWKWLDLNITLMLNFPGSNSKENLETLKRIHGLVSDTFIDAWTHAYVWMCSQSWEGS